MPTISNLVVLVTANTSQFTTAMGQASATTAASTSKMGGALSKFSSVAKVGAGLAAFAIAKFAADSVAAYQESEVALVNLENALAHAPQLVGETTDAFVDQASALQMLTGRQDEEIVAADAVLTRFGLTGDEIRDLIPLIVDYAQVVGTDATSAAENIGKALLGNTRALKTVGVQFTATGNTAADVATIMEGLQQKVGGAAEAFGRTSAGQIAIFNAKLDEAKESIGQALIPVIDALIPVLQDFADEMAAAGPAIEKIGHAIEFLLSVSPGLIQFLSAVTKPDFLDFVRDMAAAVVGIQPPVQDAARAWGTYLGPATSAVDSMVTTTEASEALAEQMRDQRLAVLGATNSYIGMLDQANQLSEAQKELERLTRRGKEGTQAYDQAVADVVLQQLAYEEGLINLAQEMLDADRSGKQIRDTIRDLGEKAGLSEDQVNDLIARLRSLDGMRVTATVGVALQTFEGVINRGWGGTGSGGNGGNGGNGGSGGGQVGGQPVSRVGRVVVTLDRRRFSDTLDFDSSYRGFD